MAKKNTDLIAGLVIIAILAAIAAYLYLNKNRFGLGSRMSSALNKTIVNLHS